MVVHAIGDRANAWLLDVFQRAAAVSGPRGRRFRIEHAQHLRGEEIPRAAARDVVPSMQPYHAADDGRWAGRRFPPKTLDQVRVTATVVGGRIVHRR